MKTTENTVYQLMFPKKSLYSSKSKNYTAFLFIFTLTDWLLWLQSRVEIIYISRMRLRLRRLCCCWCGVWWWGPLSEDPELLFSSLAPLQAKGDNLKRILWRTLNRFLIQKEVISDLKRETSFCQKRYGILYMIDLWREISKPVLKLDFMAHDIIESLPLRIWTLGP
jgi:hypothetical protein